MIHVKNLKSNISWHCPFKSWQEEGEEARVPGDEEGEEGGEDPRHRHRRVHPLLATILHHGSHHTALPGIGILELTANIKNVYNLQIFSAILVHKTLWARSTRHRSEAGNKTGKRYKRQT